MYQRTTIILWTTIVLKGSIALRRQPCQASNSYRAAVAEYTERKHQIMSQSNAFERDKSHIRSIGRQLAREIPQAEMEAVASGFCTCSTCSCGGAQDDS